MLQNAVLHLLESEVIAVQLFARGRKIEVVRCGFVPGQVEHQLQIGHQHGVLGHGRVEPFELLHLLFEVLGHGFGPLLLLGPFAQAVDLLVGVVAQLVLYGSHLLLQVVVALLLVDLLLHLLLDLVLEFGQLLVADQYLEQLAGAGQQTRSLQQGLLVLIGEVQVGADEGDHPLLRLDVLDGERGLLREVGREVDEPQRHVADRVDQRLELDAVLVRNRGVAQGGDGRLQIGVGRDVLAHLDLLQTVQNDGIGAVGHLQYLDDAGRRAHLVEVVGRGVLDVALALQYGAQDARGGVHLLDQADALLAADRDGGHRARKEDRGAERQNGNHFGYGGLLRRRVGRSDDGHDLVSTVEQLGQGTDVVHFDGFDLIFFAHRFFDSVSRMNSRAKITIF